MAFVSADRAAHGFTCDRTEFLGRGGSLARPEALGRWGLSGATDGSVDPCAALQTHVDIAAGRDAVAALRGRTGARQSACGRARPEIPTSIGD